MSWPTQEAVQAYLRADNPRLLELKARYARFRTDVTRPMHWDEGYVAAEEIAQFRGDNAYLWQLRGDNMERAAYALATYYVLSIDHLGLLDRLQEDGSFGACTFEIAGRRVSRDLLDAIMEIYFLDRHLGLSDRTQVRMLDIGAGYGRLAHRMLGGLDNISSYLCTDAVAVSTFLCDFHLRHRGLEARGCAVPLDEIEAELERQPIDIAVNVHSFSECHLPAIDWWLALLARHQVEYLMLVPNANDHGGERLANNDGVDFAGLFDRHGYRLIAREPKYRDPVVHAHAINPTMHYLFRRQAPIASP